MTTFDYQPEVKHLSLHTDFPKCQDDAAHHFGYLRYEPIIMLLDSVIRYAKAYNKRFDFPLSNDVHLGEGIRQILSGIKTLLDGDGAVAWETDSTCDSKSNHTCNLIIQQALKLTGFEWEEL